MKDEGKENPVKTPNPAPTKSPCTLSQQAGVFCIMTGPKNGQFLLPGPVTFSFIITTPSPTYEIYIGPHADSVKLVSQQSGNSLTLPINEPSKTYYWKFSASGLCGGCATGISKFTVVKDTALPYVETRTVAENQNFPVSITGEVFTKGSAPLVECGIYIGEFQKPQDTGTKINTRNETGLFSLMLDNLNESTVYYVTAFAKTVMVSFTERK